MRQRETYSLMKKFLFRFLLWLFFLFALFYFEHFSPLIFITHLQTDLTVYLTKLWIDFFKLPIHLNDTSVFYRHGLQLQIINDCNGFAHFLFIAAAILAYPASGKKRLYWILLSYVVILFANTLRLDAILYHVIEHPEDFTFVHEVLGRYLMALVPLILFYLFSKRT